MTRTARRLALGAALAVGAAGVVLGQSPVAWEELTEADWLYSAATRFADVEGHRVHYPTPTAELVPLLEQRSEAAAKRYLADARLALGDRAGALEAIQAWAESEGPAAWAEVARWAAERHELAAAFRAAARALPGLDEDEKHALADQRVLWADAHPEAADPIAMRAARAQLLPADAPAAEDWLRTLEKAGRIDEALAGIETTTALGPERRLLLRSDLAADHGDTARAFDILDAAVDAARDWPIELKRAFAQRLTAARPGAAESWRASLDTAFEPKALVRLSTLFQGQDRGEQAADLLRQVERRHEARLDRAGWLLLTRLHSEIDAVPEAFRARLAAASSALPPQQADDLAALARLALRAGSRPLGWGTFNDEPYRWAARVDRTPGFWTGGIAFLLTGTDWNQALGQLEADSLPERTFATARALTAELATRVPTHAELPALRAAIMMRHVERGEGRDALALLPLVAGGPASALAEARRAALLAMRQVETPLDQEVPLWRARLTALAPDGSRPETSRRGPDRFSSWSGESFDETDATTAWHRAAAKEPGESYADVLREAIARLDQRDRSHHAAIALILAELDRLPRAEGLWLELADRLAAWNLDDEMGPRYERALANFQNAGWWARAARWYARRSRQRELDRLATDLTLRFRSSAVFERAPSDDGVRLVVPESSRAGVRVSLVTWGDWVRVKALQRFPHSPIVFHQALGRLRDVVDPGLLEERRWAVLFADQGERESYLAQLARNGTLATRLAEWEGRTARTPVEEILIFEGRARLSQFEEAAAAAARLTANCPGDGAIARRVLSLHRSLAALAPSHASTAAAIVARSAPALVDPAPLWTELGEIEHDSGRPDRAKESWRHIVERDPRDPERINELATLLWDYGETDDALATIEDARRRLARPALLAFEAGVLREEKHDIDGAIREYLQSGQPAESGCFCSAFESDQRALRRLSQLIGRPRVRAAVEARIAALQPGTKADEESLVALYPLATIRMPDADLDWTSDDWIDALDHPFDPVARQQRAEAREAWRAASRDGAARIADALLARTQAMVATATRSAFLDAVDRWARPLLEAQTDRQREVALTAAVLARRASLATAPEERITRDMAYANYLFSNHRRAEADLVWQAISSRVETLPEGASRMHAESGRAAYFERARGPAVAAAEWERLAGRYPWSLGLLEDRLAFLRRAGRDGEARAVLERAAARAASGHREALLERLAREAIAKSDLPQARRATEALLASPDTDDARRLAGAHLLARLSLRQDAAADLLGLAKTLEPRLRPESRAELHAQIARAAELEAAWKGAVTLWVEALNRRLDRGWLRESCRAAEAAGEAEAFVSFFERQRARSPRDVRWAVALRELRLYFADAPGAVVAARAAIAVRPDRQSLWLEAADLHARLGRPRDGADLLADWMKPRPADERAAERRAQLLAAAGDGDAALAVERAALAAFAAERPLDEARTQALAARRARAARSLLSLGLPRQAYALLSPTGSARLLQSDLGPYAESELTLAAGRFLPLLRQRIGDQDFRSAAASVLAQRARPEDREEVARWLADQILPPPAAAVRRAGTGMPTLWPFVREADLTEPVKVDLARRVLARRPGPWTATPGEAFIDAVAASVVDEAHDTPRLGSPPLERLWVADLVARRRADDLWLFLAPRWDGLLAAVRSNLRVDPAARYGDWRRWLDDRETLALWAEAATHDRARIASVASVMTDRRSWDRLWGLGAKTWDVSPLVAALPDDARTRWFRMWMNPSPTSPDPSLRARGELMERTTLALGRLIVGGQAVTADPVIGLLRGPGSVGAVLDDHAPPNRDLWGDRVAPPWLVLETLVRLREKDPTAALVPYELADRSGETGLTRLAARLAEASGDPDLALARAQEVPAPDASDLARRLRLIRNSGGPDNAAAAFRDEIRKRQPRLDETGFRALERTADDLGLPEPASLLDPQTPVPGALLAFLCDVRGLASCRPLRSVAVSDFRTALWARWQRRARALSAEETRFALTELWANDAGPLPLSSLRRLGPQWARSADWLATVRPGDRSRAIAALDALPESTPLATLLGSEIAIGSPAWLLKLRVHLLRGEDTPAREMLSSALETVDQSSGLSFTPAAPAAGEDLSAEDEGEAAPDEASPAYSPTSSVATNLRAWLGPFREAGKLAAVADTARERLLRHTTLQPRDIASWSLALDLASSPATREPILASLERAWRLGDLDASSLGPLVESAGRISPAEADRWLARLADRPSFQAAAARARLIAQLGRQAEAARYLAETRARGAWSAADDTRAFDLWRSFAPAAQTAATGGAAGPSAPAAWVAAYGFWKRPAAGVGADLVSHLRTHPLDSLAARAALRTVAPAAADLALLAARALRQTSVEGDAWRDIQFLMLRAARGSYSTSPVAARKALVTPDAALAAELERRRLPAAEVKAALADVARILTAAKPSPDTTPAAINRSDSVVADAALTALEDRDAAAARALRAELARLTPYRPPRPYRMANGKPEPWRPFLLDWPVVGAVLDAEGRP